MTRLGQLTTEAHRIYDDMERLRIEFFKYLEITLSNEDLEPFENAFTQVAEDVKNREHGWTETVKFNKAAREQQNIIMRKKQTQVHLTQKPLRKW